MNYLSNNLLLFEATIVSFEILGCKNDIYILILYQDD